MPNRTLTSFQNGSFARKFAFLLIAPIAILGSLGCGTNFKPGALSELFVDSPKNWSSDVDPPADYVVVPGTQEALDSVNHPEVGESRKSTSILPEIDADEFVTQIEESQRESESASSMGQTNPQKSVPAAAVMNQPLRPISDVAEAANFRTPEVIRLKADPPSGLPSASPATPAPAYRTRQTFEPILPEAPELPTAEIVDSRYTPDPQLRVELPTPDAFVMGRDAATIDSQNSNGLADSQITSTIDKDTPPPFVECPELESMPHDELISTDTNGETKHVADLAQNHSELSLQETTNHNDFSVPQQQLSEIPKRLEFEPAPEFELPGEKEPPRLELENSSVGSSLFASGDPPIAAPIATAIAPSHRSEFTDQGSSVEVASHENQIGKLEAQVEKDVSSNQFSKPVFKLVNANFCTAVSGFGQFDAFELDRFGPNQHLLVYCEIENFVSIKDTSAASPQYKTRLRGSYEIVNASGAIVDSFEFPVVEDKARSHRRDFYVHLPVQLSGLVPGSYSLQIRIDDLNGKSTAKLGGALPFEVME